MNKIFFAAFSFFAVMAFSGCDFSSAPPQSNNELYAWSGDIWRRIDFPDTSTGYFWPSPGDYTTPVLKTTDGGVTWRSTTYFGPVFVMRFYNNNIGMLLPGNQIICRTLNGGTTWDRFTSPDTGWGSDIRFDPMDPARVWMTDYRKLFFSNDTGRTWEIQLGSDSVILRGRCITITGSNEGWLLCDSTVYRMTDGTHWNSADGNLPEGFSAYALDAVDANTAVISTDYGLFKTINSGTTWEDVSVSEPVMSISMRDNLNICIASLTTIYRTVNGGTNWTAQYSDQSKTDFFNYIKLFDPSHGIAMGDPTYQTPTLFLSTTDGGVTWVQRIPILN